MTLKMMDDMRNQFFDLLSDIGFVSKMRGVKVSISLLSQTCSMILYI
jgi:hypothetical protein